MLMKELFVTLPFILLLIYISIRIWYRSKYINKIYWCNTNEGIDQAAEAIINSDTISLNDKAIALEVFREIIKKEENKAIVSYSRFGTDLNGFFVFDKTFPFMIKYGFSSKREVHKFWSYIHNEVCKYYELVKK